MKSLRQDPSLSFHRPDATAAMTDPGHEDRVQVGVAVAVLAGVIGAEQLAAARRRARGEPSPLERLDGSAGA